MSLVHKRAAVQADPEPQAHEFNSSLALWTKPKLFKSWLFAMAVLGILLMGEPKGIENKCKTLLR